MTAGDLQLSLFDETNLAEITSPLSWRAPRGLPQPRPGRRAGPQTRSTPGRHRDRARQDHRHGRRAARAVARRDAGSIGERAGGSSTATRSPSTSPSHHRRYARVAAQERADRPAKPPSTASTCSARPPRRAAQRAAVVRAYKQLKMAERAFRTMKDTLEMRPIHHHLETRVRAHIFLCMLAYYLAFELHHDSPTAVYR